MLWAKKNIFDMNRGSFDPSRENSEEIPDADGRLAMSPRGGGCLAGVRPARHWWWTSAFRAARNDGMNRLYTRGVNKYPTPSPPYWGVSLLSLTIPATWDPGPHPHPYHTHTQPTHPTNSCGCRWVRPSLPTPPPRLGGAPRRRASRSGSLRKAAPNSGVTPSWSASPATAPGESAGRKEAGGAVWGERSSSNFHYAHPVRESLGSVTAFGGK